MSNFLLGFLAGAVLVDFLWAWKFGIPQHFWYNFKRFCKRKIIWLTF